MSLLAQIQSVRNNAGIWMRRDHTVLIFSGRDAASWLHAQTTNEVTSIPDGHGNLQALVNRQGRLQCVFQLFRFGEECWAVIEVSQVPALLERFETHHFLEDVTVTDVGGGAGQIVVEGPGSLLFLSRHLEPVPEPGDVALPASDYAFGPYVLCGKQVLIFRVSETGEDGFLIVAAPGEDEELYESLAAEGGVAGVPEITEPARNTLRIESGLPVFGRDWDASTVIAETPFEALAVSYEKGCYLGQEVVTRLKTYGTPKVALVGLHLEAGDPDLPALGAPLYSEGARAGDLRSYSYSPTLGYWIARAYLDRDHRSNPGLLTLSDETGKRQFRAHVRFLPFYQPLTRRAHAERLYQEALGHFEKDADDQDDTAIRLLENALRLAPEFEDAFEALGVILHRHHRVDEAIAVMRKLAALNPDCVMAHSNLSVFYVSKGWIREAEDEKAIAEQLEHRHQVDAQLAARQAAQERARIRSEAEERVGMFLEVIEIDPEDPIATMGLGTAYMQLERYGDAIPHLVTATKAQKDYSAAFLSLGKCHEFTGDIAQAIAAYQDGIAAAGRKGDLMPMREMERRLKALQVPSATTEAAR